MCEKNANDRKTDRRRRVNVGAYMTYDSLDGRLSTVGDRVIREKGIL